MKIMKNLILILLLFTIKIPVHSQNWKVEVEAPKRVSVDECFEIRILTTENYKEFHSQADNMIKRLENDSLGESVSYNSWGSISYSDSTIMYYKEYEIKPKKLGNFIIKPFTFIYNGKGHNSSEVSIEVIPAIQMKHEQDSIKREKKAYETSLINNHILKLEKAEQVELIKKIDDYIWTSELLCNIKKSNPAKYKTMLKEKRLLIYGRITHITEDTKYLGYISKVVYNIVLDSNIIIEVESAEEVSKYNIGDNIYTLIKTANRTTLDENIPIFYPVFEEDILKSSVNEVVNKMKSHRKFNFDEPRRNRLTSYQCYDADRFKDLISVFTQFEYRDLYIPYLLKIPTE